MDLGEFVKETLVQIAQGVAAAQGAARDAGGVVSPAMAAQRPSDTYFGTIVGNLPVFLIEFDVAVTATKGKGTNAEARVEIAPILKLGAGGRSSQAEEHTSRVKFRVPIALPIDATSLEERDKAVREARARAKAQIAVGARNWVTDWRP